MNINTLNNLCPIESPIVDSLDRLFLQCAVSLSILESLNTQLAIPIIVGYLDQANCRIKGLEIICFIFVQSSKD